MSRPLVVVLGGTGFIGSTVVARLARRPIRLRVVGRRPASVPAGARATVESVTVDVTDRDALPPLVADADTVIHLLAHTAGDRSWRLAGSDDHGRRVNTGALLEVIESIGGRPGGRPPPVVALAGSTGQVGCPPRTRIDGSEPDHPASPYDEHKLAAERALEDASRAGVLRAITLRLPTVYGAGADPRATGGGVVAAMVRRALDGAPLTMWHDGSVRRDLVHVDDVARAFLAAVDHAGDLEDRHWLIGSGRGRPLGEVFELIAALTAEHTGGDPVPVRSVDPPAHAVATDFHGVEVDASPFRARTGWRPRVGLEEGLLRTIAGASAQRGRIRS